MANDDFCVTPTPFTFIELKNFVVVVVGSARWKFQSQDLQVDEEKGEGEKVR